MNTSRILGLGVAALGLTMSASGQLLVYPSQMEQEEVIYRADIKTVQQRGTDASTSPLSLRLYLDPANATPAPVGTTIWLVADTAHNGLPFTAGGLQEIDRSQLLGPDDRVLFRDAIDGDQPGIFVGRYRRLGVPIMGLPSERQLLENATIWLMLWNAQGSDYDPKLNATFGFKNLGEHPPPATGFGNAFWSVEQDINASAVRVVPEPASQALVFGVASILFAGLSRFRRGNRV